MSNFNIIGLIPARSGSQRIKNKNIKKLGEHPLLAYSISVARCAKIFDKIVCVTDSKIYSKIATKYGAEVPALRPKNISKESSPDIEWIKWILDIYKKKIKLDIFVVLRPTSPFRSVKMIKKALDLFTNTKVDSLRAIEKSKQHPGKMWFIDSDLMKPVLKKRINNIPWHSNQTKILPQAYIQNASLEISWVSNIYKKKSISGSKIIPFITKGFEGHDINVATDFEIADQKLKEFLNNNSNIKDYLKNYI